MRFQGSSAPIWFFNGLLIACAAHIALAPSGAIWNGADSILTRAVRSDPDSCPARDLRALPGIGPTRAAAIVRARWEGLRGGPAMWQAIPGIGEATVRVVTEALSGGALEPSSERAYTSRVPP